MFVNLDTICGTESLIKELSYTDAVISLFLIFLTIPANVLMLLSIAKFRHLLHRSFYLIIANITLADLITATIVCPLSVNFHIKEGFGNSTSISQAEVKSLHYTFFFTNTVSVLSMAVLSIDRLGVLLNPFFYYSKMTKLRTIALLALTWLISAGLTVLYFRFGYIRYLAIFAFTTVAMTMIIMLVTMGLFKRRLIQSEKSEYKISKANSVGPRELNDSSANGGNKRRTLHTFTQMDKRITKTFLCMLLLFLVNYLPTVILTIYMNGCVDCNCTLIHVMRDIVFISILSSGLCRAVNFMVRLTTLREAVKSILKSKHETDGNDFMYL